MTFDGFASGAAAAAAATMRESGSGAREASAAVRAEIALGERDDLPLEREQHAGHGHEQDDHAGGDAGGQMEPEEGFCEGSIQRRVLLAIETQSQLMSRDTYSSQWRSSSRASATGVSSAGFVGPH